MTDHGDYIEVEVGEAGLDALLKTVSEQGRPVRILDHGQPVAELSALPRTLRPLATDPSLKVAVLVDDHELMSADDWPEDLKVDVSSH